MQVIRRIAVIVGITLTLALGSLITVLPASASTVHMSKAHTASQVIIPLGNGPFDVSTTGARVTGTINFTGSTTFQLLNVILYDTKCDSSSAYFQAQDQFSAYKVHQNGGGCGSALHFGTLNGSASYSIDYLYIIVWTNSNYNYGGPYYNPY
jgi:hypothetical protein